jgi:hypothetical protein
LTEGADERREEKIREGCHVYASAAERAKQGERTISMGELTGVQAIERKHPDLAMQPGHLLRREFEYIRHGTLSWFINFDVVSGQMIEPSWGVQRTEEDALAHLQRLIASDPQARKWHLVLDNLNIHQSEALVLWVAQQEGIAVETLGVKSKSGILRSMESRAAFLHDPTHQVVLYYTPKHASWMNQVEIWLSIQVAQTAETGQFHRAYRFARPNPGLHCLLQSDHGQTYQVDIHWTHFIEAWLELVRGIFGSRGKPRLF